MRQWKIQGEKCKKDFKEKDCNEDKDVNILEKPRDKIYNVIYQVSIIFKENKLLLKTLMKFTRELIHPG